MHMWATAVEQEAPEAKLRDELDGAVEEVEQSEVEPTDGQDRAPHEIGRAPKKGAHPPEGARDHKHPQGRLHSVVQQRGQRERHMPVVDGGAPTIDRRDASCDDRNHPIGPLELWPFVGPAS